MTTYVFKVDVRVNPLVAHPQEYESRIPPGVPCI